MKKLVSAVLSICIVCIFSVSVSASDVFLDITKTDWYYNSVVKANEKGYMTGTGNQMFSPEAKMTRAMFVQLLANYTSDYTADQYKGKTSFSDDVAETAWYAAAVEWAYQNQIISGTSMNAFSPEKNLSRQEMVTMLYRYAVKTGNEVKFSSAKLGTFTDRSKIDGWAMMAMGWATDKQIINGIAPNILSPQQSTTRAEVATMIVNSETVLLQNRINGAGNPPLPPTVTPPPNPVDPDQGNSVDYSGNPEKKLRPTGRSKIDADGGYYDYDLSAEIMDQINALRKEKGLHELDYSVYFQGLNDIRSKEVWHVVKYNGVILGQGNSHTRPDGTKFSTVGIGANAENNMMTNDYTGKIQYDANGNRFVEMRRTIYHEDGTGSSYIEVMTFEDYFEEYASNCVEGWYNSEGHRMNMMSIAAKTATVSCYVKDGWIYAVQLISHKPYYILNLTEK